MITKTEIIKVADVISVNQIYQRLNEKVRLRALYLSPLGFTIKDKITR